MVLLAKSLNLLPLTMGGVCHKVDRQMALPSALEKDVASLNVTHLHVGTAPHLQSNLLGGPTVIVEGILTKETVIGNFNVMQLNLEEGFHDF